MKSSRLSLLAAALLLVSGASQAAVDAAVKADAQGVDVACATEAATSGCTGQVVGKGLLKCMGAYRKAHPDFKFSTGCQASMKQLGTDAKAAKTAPAATPATQ